MSRCPRCGRPWDLTRPGPSDPEDVAPEDVGEPEPRRPWNPEDLTDPDPPRPAEADGGPDAADGLDHLHPGIEPDAFDLLPGLRR